MQEERESRWEPRLVLECPADYKYAMVVLNQAIRLRHEYVLPMWEKAQITVTVDGGTNHWMRYLGEKAGDVLAGKCRKYLPNLVTGDMDSIAPNLLTKLKNTPAKVVYTPDVMETDYTKAMKELKEHCRLNNIQLNGIHVLIETGGRFDQVISSVNTLYKCDKMFHDLWVIQIASNSLTWLLKAGSHKIVIPKILLEKKSWCSLIPFGESNSSVSTTGLKWNLNNTCMQFGKLISTSNTYSDESEVSVRTDTFLVWSMGIEPITGVDET